MTNDNVYNPNTDNPYWSSSTTTDNAIHLDYSGVINNWVALKYDGISDISEQELMERNMKMKIGDETDKPSAGDFTWVSPDKENYEWRSYPTDIVLDPTTFMGGFGA